MRSTNRYSFIRSLKRKGFKEEIVIKIGLYDLVTSTTLESNKSLARYSCTSFVEASGTEQAHRLTSPAWNRMHGESVSPCAGDLDVDDQRSPPAANAA